MSIRPPSLAALVTLTAATCSCGCDLPACQSTETATFSLRPSEGQLVGAALSACRNEVCQTGSLSTLEGAAASPYAMLLPLDAQRADNMNQLTVFATVGAEQIDFELTWTLPSAGTLDRRDLLGTRVATAQDEELFAAQASVANIRASSDACSDRSCRSGSVDLAAP